MIREIDNEYAIDVKKCPLCGSKLLSIREHSAYHSGTCLLANHSLPKDVWNNFPCWENMDTLGKTINVYREIAINSEMQWRKLHGEVVPFIQRESVENYIDSLANQKLKKPRPREE